MAELVLVALLDRLNLACLQEVAVALHDLGQEHLVHGHLLSECLEAELTADA